MWIESVGGCENRIAFNLSLKVARRVPYFQISPIPARFANTNLRAGENALLYTDS